MVKELNRGIYLINENNLNQKLFEGEIPLVKGMSYNSSLIIDKKVCLQDTCDISVYDSFLKDLTQVLDGRKIDCFVVHHLEPDHTAALIKLLDIYPEAEVYISSLGYMMFKNFFQTTIKNVKIVKEGDVLDLGDHKLKFITAQMVHWPEVIMTYETTSNTLFSADAFGAFMTVEENKIYADEYDWDSYIDESRRYYTNIVGKYGMQVTAALEKVLKLDIQLICPLHGAMVREANMGQIASKYHLWSSYLAEKRGVLVCACSIYGHTLDSAHYFCDLLKDDNIEVDLVDLNAVDVSYAVSKSFIYSNIVLFCPTFNNGMYPKMEQYLSFLKARLVKNKNFTLIENGSWAPVAKKLMTEVISSMSGNTISPKSLTIHSSMSESDKKALQEIKEDFTMEKNEEKKEEKKPVKKWRCTLCGYIYEGEELPKDYVCPMCGASADMFEEVEE